MQVIIDSTETLNNIQYQMLDRGTKIVNSIFDIPPAWCKVLIPTSRRNIKSITIGNVDIKHLLNSGSEWQGKYSIWLHGDLDVLLERVQSCIDRDDLIKWSNLSKKYLLTESFNEQTPDYLPAHLRNFYARGQGPYWWNRTDTNLPFRESNVSYDPQRLYESIHEDLTYQDKKFYNKAKCISLQQSPNLPLTPVVALKNNYLKSFLSSAGYVSVLQVQYVEMEPNSYIDLHRDDFARNSGLIYIKGASQLYCVLRGDPKKFKMRFSKAGSVDLTKPIHINNNSFVHSLYYNGDDVRGALLVYGNS